MPINILIAAVIFMMVQAVVFGIGCVAILETPLSAHAINLMPWMTAASFLVSVPLTLILAPRLRARFERRSSAPGV